MVLQRTAKKCTKSHNARAEPLFCSLNLLFSDVPVAVAVVVILNSLLTKSDDREAGVRFVNHKYDYRLLPINQNYDKIPETNKASIER